MKQLVKIKKFYLVKVDFLFGFLKNIYSLK